MGSAELKSHKSHFTEALGEQRQTVEAGVSLSGRILSILVNPAFKALHKVFDLLPPEQHAVGMKMLWCETPR